MDGITLQKIFYTHTHTHTHTLIYIYISYEYKTLMAYEWTSWSLSEDYISTQKSFEGDKLSKRRKSHLVHYKFYGILMIFDPTNNN